MAEASFAIELQRAGAAPGTIRAGDELEAVLRYSTPEDHDEVTLEWALEWVAEGKSTNTGRVSYGSKPLGPLAAGEQREARLPLSIPPEGPVTYTGELLSISWRLRVSLDIPWAFDPKTEVDLVVEPALALADAWKDRPLPGAGGAPAPKKKKRRRKVSAG